jgi:hypothetical protein
MTIKEIQVGQEFVIADGTIVRVMGKKVKSGAYYLVCEDSHLNECSLKASEVIKCKAYWPLSESYRERYRVKIGERVLSEYDGYYKILKQESNRVLIQWENTSRITYVNIAFIGNSWVRDKIEGHYVYAATYNNEIVYVGKGQDNRWLHCTSGVSHVYELNKLHFEGKEVTVEIIKEDMTADEAFKFERELIEKINPPFNKVYCQN